PNHFPRFLKVSSFPKFLTGPAHAPGLARNTRFRASFPAEFRLTDKANATPLHRLRKEGPVSEESCAGKRHKTLAEVSQSSGYRGRISVTSLQEQAVETRPIPAGALRSCRNLEAEPGRLRRIL